MRLREPLLVSLVTVLSMATPVVTMSPAAAASAKAPTIVGVVPSTATARTGSKLAIKIVAENESGQASASYKLQFLLSKTKSPTGARKIGEGTLSSFAAKTRKTFGFSVAIPSNAAAGSFRLLLCHPRAGQPLRCHQDNVKLTVTLAPAKLALSPTSYNFGDVVKDEVSGAKRFTVRNVGRRASGSVAVSLSGAKASSFHIAGKTCGSSLAPNATCTIDVTFTPTATGTAKATLKAKPSAAYSVGAAASLTGIGVIPSQLAIAPVDDFGSVAAGTTSPAQTVTVSNTGGQPAGPITITITGSGFEDFVFTDNTCAAVALAAGASCTVKVKFGPFAPGASTATFTAAATPGGPVTTQLTGTGVAPAHFTISPTTHDFGGVLIGDTALKSFTVTNTGGVTSGAVSHYFIGSSRFETESTDCPSGGLGAGASCLVTVQFSPGSADAETGSLKVLGSVDGPVSATLSGSGVTPAQLTASSVPDFGTVATGTSSAAKTVTFTNGGGLMTGTITTSIVGGSTDQFSKSDDTCNGATLAPGASCTVKATFSPTGTGLKVASLRAEASSGGAAEAPLSGTGATPAAFSLNPGSLDFGTIPIGTSLVKTATLTNTGGVPTGNLDIYFNGSDGYALDGATTTCTSAPLAAGASCVLGVKFSPSSDFESGGIMNVLANPPGFSGLAQLYVGGQGVPPPI